MKRAPHLSTSEAAIAVTVIAATTILGIFDKLAPEGIVGLMLATFSYATGKLNGYRQRNHED